MRLDLEGESESIPNLYDARILPRALNHPRSPGGKEPQEALRILVPAVLGPHRGEDAELGEGGRPAENLEDLSVLTV